MKKALAVLLCGLLVLGFVACGGKNDEKNGTYTAEVSDEYATTEGHGYKDTLTVTYENGVIADAKFESYDVETGEAKSQNDAYPMEPSPTEWIPELNAQIVAGGSSDNIDGITGATNASTTARSLLAAIEKEGKAGETIVVEP